ncbi:MAG: hypothetical protein OJF59_001864 [Cytophagales bacterium]|jgi:hypothetical protein|nr:hypothetical protein [Bacteroidota bacterium]MBS1980772.1 hypothetical protein [Bacteroidota bacterium]WHZ08111.1 MAG: hypothetical protein OJF59_001864 [Cytophagales bacterium]
MRKIVLGVFLLSGIVSFGQSYQDSLKKDDDDIITSIAPYSQDVRNAILNVAQYSNVLVKVERIQSRTSQSFQDMLSPYSRDEQEKFYELARYPDLVHQLVDGPPKTLEQVKPLLTSYPQEVNTAVNALFPMKLADLTAMDKTYQNSQKSLDKLLANLPTDAQADFKKIIAMPQVMNLLTEHIDLVVSLGDAYKNDPAGTRHKLDSLSTDINAQSQKDLDDYKKQVANDPQMQEEMKKSAEDFADSYSANGDSAALNQGNTSAQRAGTQPQVVNNNYYYGSNYNPNPYAYWFGYPYWYDYPMWYPYPLYYHTGFYIGAGGAVVVVGLPSRAYSGWFFNYGYHRYPHYYNFCNTYYNSRQVYVNRINVYQGFNTHVNNHFTINRVNRDMNINRNYNVNRNVNVNRNMNINRNENFNRYQNFNRSENVNRGMNMNRNTNSFRNSINQPTNNFNRQGYSNFRATQFHQQNWGGGGGFRSGGGGGFRSGGGFHGGRR